MKKQKTIDFYVGLFMILAMIGLTIMVMKVSGINNLLHSDGYHVYAEFANIGGLKVRAPVTVAGVKIGEVSKIELQPADLNARVTLTLNKDKPIPAMDASARILTEGLLGSNYISIVPGFDDEENPDHNFLREGDIIAKTQEAIILENLIGQLLFNINKK